MFAFSILDRFLDHVIMGFFHKAHLIKRHPEKVPDLLVDWFYGVTGNDKIEVSAPAYNARSDLVNERTLGIDQF